MMTRTWFDRCYSRLLDDEPIVPDPRLQSLYECDQGPNKGKPGPCPQQGGADATAAQPAAAKQQPAQTQGGGGKPAGPPDSSAIMAALGGDSKIPGDTIMAALAGDSGMSVEKYAERYKGLEVEAADFEKAIKTPEGIGKLKTTLSEKTAALDVEMKKAKGIPNKNQRDVAVQAVQSKIDDIKGVGDALDAIEATIKDKTKGIADLKTAFDNLAQQGLDPRDIIRKLAGLAGAENIAGQFLA